VLHIITKGIMLPFTYKMFKLHNSYKLLLQQKEVEYVYDEYNIDE
jgi:hypothetical protein